MDDRYKVIISNKNLYKEIEIAPDSELFTVGTDIECDVRLRKELFFMPIKLIFTKLDNKWNVMCSDGLYLASDDLKKLLKIELVHGNEVKVRYDDSDSDVLDLYFILDFDYQKKDYRRQLDILGMVQIKIGGTQDSQIMLSDRLIKNDYIVLTSRQGKIYLKDVKTRYGVYVNGAKIQGEKEIRDYDFFSIVGYSFYYRDGNLYTSMSPEITVNGINWKKTQEQSTHFDYPKFIRNTRISYQIPEEQLEIQQPPAKPKKSEKSLVMTLIPALIMLAMTIVLRGIMGNGGTFVIYSAVSMSLGIITSIVTYVQENKSYKKEWSDRIAAYNQYISNKIEKIQQSRNNELRIKRLTYVSLEDNLTESNLFGRRLFERTMNDTDFLQVYMGTGRVESLNQIKYTQQEFIDMEDPLAMVAENLAETYRYIDDAPIVADFKMANGIGVVGRKESLYQAVRNMTLDLAIRQFYRDVKFAYILKPEDIHTLSWIRWLKNVENDKLDIRNIVCDEESKNILLEYFYVELSARENMLAQNSDYMPEDRYIVFVFDSSVIRTHPVAKYTQNCSQYGFTFVYFEEYEENIPQGCAEIIRMDEDNHGGLITTENGDNLAMFCYPVVSDMTARQIALKLAGIYVDEIALESTMTKNISLFELLGIISVDDLDLKKRWNDSRVYKTMSVPLGVKNKNQIVSLDISDKAGAHGPHGLVAGTTGSGKSEILQTYILSLATYFHPYEVGFVIIDFKGGGMANQFRGLPHLIGTITNIDGREINRSLLSIKAELVKRQEMFSACGVNHINDYIKLYKENKVQVPMPHLIMIVDEFAELKAEHPDFMKELISAARIGRTLGIHLILATQKPAGVVDAQIWSNSKFKLCLKVQTREDSTEVLKTPLAAEIVEPGRAYFQVGNNEIFELFQSAYSGAPVPVGNDAREKLYEIYERNVWGKKTLKYTNKKKKQQESQTQLQVIVEYVSEYCQNNRIEQLPGICLPSLKDYINTEELNYEKGEENGITIPIGIYDNPEQQQQGQVNIELSRENIYIVGSAQTGKTVLLQTIAYGLIRKYTSRQVNIYMVDCGSMVLKIFEESSHVGGVVLSNEEEKCKNLFKLINSIILQRKQILSAKGIGSYLSYLEAGYEDLPLIVIMIDNVAAFKEYFPAQADEINGLSREAQGVGISFIITAATSNAMNYRTQANFGRKIVLNCNDTGEYSNVFGHCRETPKEVAGRGLWVLEKRILEYQTAMFGKSAKEAERSEELKFFMEQSNTENAVKATRIPMIPDRLILSEVMDENNVLFREKGELVIGMDYENVSYKTVNINQSGSLTLLGNAQSRERFLDNLLQMLAQTIVFQNIEAAVIDDKMHKFDKVQDMGFVRAYTNEPNEATMIISAFCESIIEKSKENPGEFDTGKLLIINNAEVIKKILADKTSSKELSDALRAANETNCFIIFANIENQSVSFNSSEVLKTLKDIRQAIFFDQLVENKMFDISGRIKPDSNFDASMGYFIENNSYSKIKIFE